MQNTAPATATSNTHIMTELEVLQSAIVHGFVKFTYKKVDGTLRTAIGTRNIEFIEQVGGTPNGDSNRTQSPLVYHYYDLMRGEWRCFRKDLFQHLCFDQDGSANITKERACAECVALGKSEGIPMGAIIGNIAILIGEGNAKRMADMVEHTDSDCVSMERVVSAVFDNTERRTAPYVKNTYTTDRKALINELMELRKRESEILAMLLLK